MAFAFALLFACLSFRFRLCIHSIVRTISIILEGFRQSTVGLCLPDTEPKSEVGICTKICSLREQPIAGQLSI